MNAYKIYPNKSYTYGCALVAADNDKEAIKTYRSKSEYNDYQYDDYNCSCVIVEKLNYYCENQLLYLIQLEPNKAMLYGVIGNTSDFGSEITGSSPVRVTINYNEDERRSKISNQGSLKT